MNIDRAFDFLGFIEERHQVWENRRAGTPQPWTENPILASRKFTNVFRLADPGSQFVITDLIDEDPEVTLMRCFLYRHTNLPAAWRAYRDDTGHYPGLKDLEDLRLFWHSYRGDGGKLFSGAYMIYPQSAVPGTNKIDSVVDLTERIFVSSKRVAHDFLNANSQTDRFAALRTIRGVADFMSMQILTDFGYSTEFREDLFVVPGPGARKGAAALEMSGERAIEWGYRATRESGPRLEGRPPSKMDIQNCLCEFSKYVRYQSKPSPQKPYSPAHPGVQLPLNLPTNW